MTEEVKKESNLSKCPVCQEIKLRIQDGKYPDGKNKKWVDEQGNLFVGRKCPSCVKSQMKARMQKFRAKR
jgi:C4-type Zn-finger protein